MFHAFVRTLLKVTIASLVVGTALAHFGVTTDRIMHEVGLSQDRVLELARQGFDLGAPPPAARLAGHRAAVVPVLSLPSAARA